MLKHSFLLTRGGQRDIWERSKFAPWQDYKKTGKMTLCIGWVRKIKETEQICMIADSCVTGGQKFLATPKLFPLKRGDCALACAGLTEYSFPVVEHIVRAMEINGPVNDLAKDFLDIVHLIVDITNKCLSEEQDELPYNPSFSMMLCGFSWKKKAPHLFKILYDKKLRKMRHSSVKTILGNQVVVIGNKTIVPEVRKAIFDAVAPDGRNQAYPIDMQPLDVLMKYINDSSHNSIDGHPQMLKIYPFFKILPIGLKSVNDNNIYYYGRPLLSYETFPFPIMEIETKAIKYMKMTTEEFERKKEIVGPLKQFGEEELD